MGRNVTTWAVRAVSALTLTVLASGCASTFDTRISAFHQLPADAQRTYAFAPTDAQRQSLEYRSYEEVMRGALAGAGFTESTQPAWRVAFGWSTNEAVRTVLRTVPVRPAFGLGLGYGTWGGWGGWGWGGWGSPFWGPGWPAYADVAQAERTVEHRLRVEMTPARGGSRVYEATAVGEASSDDMPSVFPLLARALFQDFPGPSGTTRVVRIELPR